jgi:transposase-like protein
MGAQNFKNEFDAVCSNIRIYPETKRALELVVVWGSSTSEAARRCGVTRQTVCRAMKKFVVEWTSPPGKLSVLSYISQRNMLKFHR